jgi:hypothetical protein
MLRSWRELRDARRKGRRDGRAGVPGTGQDALPFDLLEIMARAQERAQRVLQRWRTLDREREIELGDLEQRSVAAGVRLAASRRSATTRSPSTSGALPRTSATRLQAQPRSPGPGRGARVRDPRA